MPFDLQRTWFSNEPLSFVLYSKLTKWIKFRCFSLTYIHFDEVNSNTKIDTLGCRMDSNVIYTNKNCIFTLDFLWLVVHFASVIFRNIVLI